MSLLRGPPGGCYQPLTLELLRVPLQTAHMRLGHATLVLVLGFLPLPLPLSGRDPLSRPFPSLRSLPQCATISSMVLGPPRDDPAGSFVHVGECLFVPWPDVCLLLYSRT